MVNYSCLELILLDCKLETTCIRFPFIKGAHQLYEFPYSMLFLAHLSYAFYCLVLKTLATNQVSPFPYSFRFAHPAYPRNHCPKWQVIQWTISLCESQMNTSHDLSTIWAGLLGFNLSTVLLTTEWSNIYCGIPGLRDYTAGESRDTSSTSRHRDTDTSIQVTKMTSFYPS